MFDTLTFEGRVGGTEEEEMQHEIWNGDDIGHQPFMSIQQNSVHYHVCNMYFMISRHMAVESGQAGWVLARPLFRRPNVHIPTLNTHEVVCIRTSKLPIIVQILLTKK